MGVGLRKIRQVKVPVTDLSVSLRWYRDLLELEHVGEFFEGGGVRGVLLLSREGEFVIALRDRAFCADQPSHRGFDLFGLAVESPQALHDLAARCDRLGVAHEPIHDRGPYGMALDIPDPDGTVLRFLWDHETVDDGGFLGVEFAADGTPSRYDTTRLGD